MESRKQQLNVVSNSDDGGSTPRPRTRQLVAVAIAVLAVTLLVAAAQLAHPPAGGAAQVAATGAIQPGNINAETVYFPSQYQNQATEITEHIQAF